MLKPLLVGVLALGGCSSASGPLDWITPDEFTMGSGSSTMNTLGGHRNAESPAYEYNGEGESSYAALTWHLPTWEGRDGGMDRETQRNMAILIDKMVADEIGEVDDSDSTPPGTTLRDDAPSLDPPEWLPKAFGGLIVLLLIFVWFKLKRSNGWH